MSDELTPQTFDPAIKANVEGHKAAREILELIAVEFTSQANTQFWEMLRDAAIEKVGPPRGTHLIFPSMEPMTAEESRIFLTQTMPRARTRVARFGECCELPRITCGPLPILPIGSNAKWLVFCWSPRSRKKRIDGFLTSVLYSRKFRNFTGNTHA